MTTPSEPWLEQVDHCIRSGQVDRAVHLLQDILSDQPEHPLANMKFGEIALQQHDFGTGERYLAAAVEADPNLYLAANNLAILYWTSGRAQLAVNLLRETTASAPTFPEAWFNLGSSHLQLHQYDDAIRAFRTAPRND